MGHMHFDEPVTILVGMGLPVTIEDVIQAYVTLQDWPTAERNSSHAVAVNACKAGLAGEVDVDTVRATLVTFARRNNILIEGGVQTAAAASALAQLHHG
jgi:hypothetical protein